MKSLLFTLGFLLLAIHCHAQIPVTYTRFKSDFNQTVYMTLGFDDLRSASDSQIEFALRSVIPSYASRIARETKRSAAGFEIAVGVSGTQSVDQLNNIVMYDVDHAFFQFPMTPTISLKGDHKQLLYYDLGKNFTWNSAGCTLTQIDGTSQMPLYSVPPFATLTKSNVDIKVHGENINTNVYKANYNMGYVDPYNSAASSIFQIGFNFYVQVGSPKVVRMQFALTFAGIININTTMDMWNIKEFTDDDIVLPDKSCSGKATNITFVGMTNYTSKGNCNSETQCQCLPPNSTQWCSVDYPVSSLIEAVQYDHWAQGAATEVIDAMTALGDVSQPCKDSVKNFLCKFYFSYCNGSVNMVKPDINLFSCGSVSELGLVKASEDQRQAAMWSNAAFSAYLAANGQTATPKSTSDSPGLQGWQIAVIAVGTVVGVALIGVVGFVVYRKSRKNYTEIKG